MAISAMTKVMVISHRSEAAGLLEEIQQAGICQVLNAEQSMICKYLPDLECDGSRNPRSLEERAGKLSKVIDFLKSYNKNGKGSLFAPRTVIDKQRYNAIISEHHLPKVVEQAEEIQAAIEQIQNRIQATEDAIRNLEPWQGLASPLEDLADLEQAKTFTYLIPDQYSAAVQEKLDELEVVFLDVSVSRDGKHAALLVALNEQAGEVNKVLRAADAEPVVFEGLKGTVAENLDKNRAKLIEYDRELGKLHENASELAEDYFKLQTLYDHDSNLLNREKTHDSSPATEQTVLFEAWLKREDFARLETIVSQFGSSSVEKIKPGEDEETPVKIENGPSVRPFEIVTRLYGMPTPTNLDPTPFLAPFFALFFGICITDAGYGLLMGVILWWIMRKLQGNKGAFKMLMMCAVMAVVAGVLTGSWFSDAFQTLIPQGTALYRGINSFRTKFMLFDPMQQPLVFFGISLALGYLQIQFGLFIAFFHNISRKDYIAGICDQLSIIILLNSLVLFGFCKAGFLPASLARFFAILAVIQAVVILFFGQRQGGWGGRIGMGAFQLFSTVFYFGDILSYLRLMALGMVGSGLGMAFNVLAKLTMEQGWKWYLAGALIFVAGHLFNLAMALLSAFVHALRLQYVEFFPKFFNGGGIEFKPLQKVYKYVNI